jgi:hypothetical protein
MSLFLDCKHAHRYQSVCVKCFFLIPSSTMFSPSCVFPFLGPALCNSLTLMHCSRLFITIVPSHRIHPTDRLDLVSSLAFNPRAQKACIFKRHLFFFSSSLTTWKRQNVPRVVAYASSRIRYKRRRRDHHDQYGFLYFSNVPL